VVAIRVFRGKVLQRKIGEVKPKCPEHEVSKSIGDVDMRKTRINRLRTSDKEAKEKAKTLIRFT
jgi:hypothetical protein